MQFHVIFVHFHAILAISAIYGLILTCWVSKCIYLSWQIYWWYFHAHSCIPSCNLMQFSCYFMQFWLFQNFFGPASTCWVSKCMYISWEIQWSYFHTISPTPSCNFMQFHAIFTQFHAILAISVIFRAISTCWAPKIMYLSWKIHWWYW